MKKSSIYSNAVKSVFIFCVSFSVLAKDTQQKVQALNSLPTIVSAGGSVTEILFAIGAQDRIVAADTSSMYPPAAMKLPKIGYYRQMSTEGVLSVQANRVFAAQGAGPESVIKQLESANVDVNIFHQPRTIDGLITLIKDIGDAADLQQNAQSLAEKVKLELTKIQNISANSNATPVFLMSANERGLMAAGSDTVPDLIMEIAGLENPYSSLNGFQTVSTESFLAINPSHIFIAGHQTNGMSAQELCKTPALINWASKNGCKLSKVDALLFLGMTPRLPEAVQDFADFINSDSPRNIQDNAKHSVKEISLRKTDYAD